MGDTEIIDSFTADGLKSSEMNGGNHGNKVRKSLKRKRVSIPENVNAEEIESRIEGLRRELDGLFRYFKDVSLPKVHLEGIDCSSSNSVIACMLEESNLPFSKLVGEIYEKLKTRDGITLASVRSAVLFVGQRSMYGIANADADVLEDDTESCLWCWETRDLKLIPKAQHGVLKIHRICRKKINERINAVSATISALQMPESHHSYRVDLMKALEKLGKVLNEAAIRSLAENIAQKNAADMAEKEVKIKEKELIKELEKSKRECEKEKKRLDRELQKEKLQSGGWMPPAFLVCYIKDARSGFQIDTSSFNVLISGFCMKNILEIVYEMLKEMENVVIRPDEEKELKRLQDEAEIEERRREKEESEMKKQLKRLQEEAEKDQRRREKEEAEIKKQLSIQKQATIMQRFLKSQKNNSTNLYDPSSTQAMPSDSPKKRDEEMRNAVTLSVDCALSMKDEMNTVDLRKSQLTSWHQLGHSIRTNKSQHWGVRHKPKAVLIKELRLTTSKGLVHGDELSLDKIVDGYEETLPDNRCQSNADISQCNIRKCNRATQLLQFDKSFRPAFYGIWPKKSHVVRSRCPFKKDPDLDYDIDSDEEWEEEDPGESLSDCDKDAVEENLEEGTLRIDDEDESEDGFLVPDGYLSENEGVHVDKMESDIVDDDAGTLPSCNQDLESEDFRVLLQQQKYLHNLTEQALRKNQPLIVSNLMHEKATCLMSEDLSGIPKLEYMCLQALNMQVFPGGPPIERVMDHYKDQEVCQSQSKEDNTTPVVAVTVILDSDLPKIVSVIRSCPYSISKVVESLQQKFPTVPKSQLRNKVREISEFVDNRWQVKKDILEKLGLSISPEKGGRKTKGIASFFLKRCLPPAGKTIDVNETSPQPCRKPSTLHQQHGNTQNLL
ncbi:hypothetical protein HHK36_013340 [Tetracentron sinense]|uniref:Chromatin assembly factor 1 subunit FAS1 n=1 Tax=Tetracentron sinense TaxID=13715 RepID=A0A834ZAW7_TETSI|nr:hypothetical protein HHK36_013340 [Tetracentron sinense]